MSETYDPLVKEEIAQFRAFQKRFIADPGKVLVFSGEGKDLLIVPQGKQGPTFGELMWGKYSLLYKVDISEHLLRFQCRLPCATDAFFFDAEVSFSCSVDNPELIVRREIRDVKLRLEPLIVEVMRGQSRNYMVSESGIAESNISDAIKSAVYDSGFYISNLVLQLGLSEEAAEYVRNLERINREKELNRAKQELEHQRKEFEQQARREEERLELERQRQQLQLELEAKRQKEDLEREIQLRDSKVSLDIQRSQQELDFEAKQQESSYQRQERKLNDETDRQIEIGRIRQQEFLEFEREKREFEREKWQMEKEKLRLVAEADRLQLQQFINRQKADFDLEAESIADRKSLESRRENLKLEQGIDSQEKEFARQQERLELESKIDRENIALDARREQLDKVQEISGKERDFELDSMTKKMERYKPIIQAGRWELLALSLSQNPEDVQFVMNEMTRQRESDRTSWVEAVEVLLRNGALEGHELEETAKNMLQGMVSVMRQNTIGLAGEVSVSSLEGVTDSENQENVSPKSSSSMPSEFEENEDEDDEAISNIEVTVSTLED